MATATTIRIEGRTADNVAFFEFLQGEAGTLAVRLKTEGAAIDLTNWDVSVRGEWYMGTVTYGGSPSISGLTKVAGRDPIELDVTVPTQTGEAVGTAEFYVPADFWAEDIALAEGNAAPNTPLFQATLYYSDGAASPTISAHRIWIAMRRGLLSPDSAGSATQRYGYPPGYIFYSNPTLTCESTAATAIDISTTPWETTLLDAEVFADRVYHQFDFSSNWRGLMQFNCGANGNIKFVLTVEHEFNGKAFISKREAQWSVLTADRQAFPMDVFDTVSPLRVGSFTDVEGTTITITEDDYAGPTTISIKLSLEYTDTRGSRASEHISDVEFSNCGVVFSQLPHGLGG